MLSDICCHLSSSVTLHGGPVLFCPIRAPPCLFKMTSAVHTRKFCVCVFVCVSVCLIEWNQSNACIQQVGSYQRRCFVVRQPGHHRLQNSSSYICDISVLLVTALCSCHVVFMLCEVQRRRLMFAGNVDSQFGN